MKKHWKTFVTAILISILVVSTWFLPSTPVLADNPSPTEGDLKVVATTLNLREGPGLAYPVLATLNEGDLLTSLSREGDWIKVKSTDKEGWVAAWLVASSEGAEPATNKIVVSQAELLNVRMEPSLSSAIVAQMNTGDETPLLQEADGWVQIEWYKQRGWVSKDYITIKEGSDDAKTNDNATSTFTVLVDEINVRADASLDSEKIGSAKYGDEFKVLKRKSNWVQVQYQKDQSAWLYSFYGSFSNNPTNDKKANNQAKVLYNATNVRASASTSANIIANVDAGQKIPILAKENDWYKVQIDNNTVGYIADWVVSTSSAAEEKKKETAAAKVKVLKTGQSGALSGRTIVIDAGHGGRDRGTTGFRGTNEKDVTLKTAYLLSDKLQAAGAGVVMTRETDEYISLRKRVAISQQANADAFISIHYDANEDNSIAGFTSYYFHDHQQPLAEAVHDGFMKKVQLADRGTQPGNYYVLRETDQVAILLELGFLTNPSEEQYIVSGHFREQAALGIYKGLIKYFGQ